ncbi:hypothetical protein ES707_22373 [subsurface metagenome]
MRVSRGDATKLTTLDRHWDEGGKTPDPWTLYRFPPSLPKIKGTSAHVSASPGHSLPERRFPHA